MCDKNVKITSNVVVCVYKHKNEMNNYQSSTIGKEGKGNLINPLKGRKKEKQRLYIAK